MRVVNDYDIYDTIIMLNLTIFLHSVDIFIYIPIDRIIIHYSQCFYINAIFRYTAKLYHPTVLSYLSIYPIKYMIETKHVEYNSMQPIMCWIIRVLYIMHLHT